MNEITVQPQAQVSVEELKAAIVSQQERRTMMVEYARNSLVQGTDYNVLQGRKALGKPGAEKICSLYNVTIGESELAADIVDSLPQSIREKGAVVLRTKLYRNGEYIGSGIGARTADKDGNDLNKTMKMARKSSLIDAVISTFGLSDLFIQDGAGEEAPQSAVDRQQSRSTEGSPTSSHSAPPEGGDWYDGEIRDVTVEVSDKKMATSASGKTYAKLTTDIGTVTAFKHVMHLIEPGRTYILAIEAKAWQGTIGLSVVSIVREESTDPQ